MSACDGFEIAIEMRLHGAADAEATAGLDTHLATCAGCREFEASARRMEDTMKRETEQIAQDIDWTRLRLTVHKIKREYRLVPVVLLVSTVLAAGVYVAIRPSPLLPPGAVSGELWSGDTWPAVVSLVAFSSVMLLYYSDLLTRSAGRLREARRAEQSEEGLLTYCRNELDERIRRLTVGWFIAPLGAAPLVFLTAWNAHRGHVPNDRLALILTEHILTDLSHCDPHGVPHPGAAPADRASRRGASWRVA
jgi:hypothetical protein